MTAIESIEGSFDKARFYQEEKRHQFEDLLNTAMDFQALYQSLGLRQPDDESA